MALAAHSIRGELEKLQVDDLISALQGCRVSTMRRIGMDSLSDGRLPATCADLRMLQPGRAYAHSVPNRRRYCLTTHRHIVRKIS